MIRGLARFLGELRRQGLVVSPAEWLDAMRALESVGIADRERVRTVLSATLVKRAEQRSVFDAAFGQFFAAPALGSRRAGRRRAANPGIGGASRHGRSEDPGAARSTSQPPTARTEASGGSKPQGRARVGSTGLRRIVEAVRAGGLPSSGRLRRVVVDVRSTDERSRSAVAGQEHRTRDEPARRELRRRMSAAEEAEIAAELPRIVEQIRLRSGRRVRSSSRGPLYPRRLFRENLAHGGVPWRWPRRRRLPRRPRVVLLIDVSWSSARAAGLFLAMATELLRSRRETRVLLFVDRAIDATRAVEGWLRGDEHAPAGDRAGYPARPGSGIRASKASFAGLLSSMPSLGLDAPSDYGRMFHGLLRSPLRPAGRDTVLLVLGDGRSNRFDAQDWAFDELAERCGAVLWLVPEPLAEWATGDSALDLYLPRVDVAVEARDLLGLSRGVSELLRRS